jgi:hypothetical protein
VSATDEVPAWVHRLLGEDQVRAIEEQARGDQAAREAKALSVLGREVDRFSLTAEEQSGFANLVHRMGEMSDAEKQEMLRRLTPNGAKKSIVEEEQVERARQMSIPAPRNDDQLWELIRELTGFEIPRVAVCDDHCAPFDWIADAYFNRRRAILVLASRELGKSLGAAILQYVNAETKPGYEGVIFAAIQPQAKQVYRYLRMWVFSRDEDGNRKPKQQILGDPTRDYTEWRTGSSIRAIVGTPAGVNSPHPNVVHADELDLMDQEVFEESRAMASSSVVDGLRIPALDIVTSTRKSAKGPMQKLIDEVEEAIDAGHKPAWEVYASCFREAAAEVPTCRRADPVQRVHRLVQLGQDPRELCQCQEYVKGSWGVQTDLVTGEEKPIPRTMESVCRGDLFRSRGWYQLVDILGKFMQMSKVKWEAQMECRRPLADGLYLPNYMRERHSVRGWVPRPEYGPIYEGVDWGGTAPSVVGFMQHTRHSVQIRGYSGNEIVVPEGSIVMFDMIVMGAIGATKLADLVCVKEATWRRRFPGWRVVGRFCDMAGKQQREDWHAHSPPLRTHWYVDRAFDHTVESLQDYVTDDRYYVDLETCASLADDFEAWRMKGGREVKDESTHGPAMARYASANIRVLHRNQDRRKRTAAVLPVVRERGLEPHQHLPTVGGVESLGQSGGVESGNWRRSLAPATPSVGNNHGEQGWRIG